MTYSTHLLRNLRIAIGKNIREKRTMNKMTINKLAKLSGVDVYKIDMYELGKDEIRLDELLKIASVFGAQVRDMV